MTNSAYLTCLTLLPKLPKEQLPEVLDTMVLHGRLTPWEYSDLLSQLAEPKGGEEP